IVDSKVLHRTAHSQHVAGLECSQPMLEGTTFTQVRSEDDVILVRGVGKGEGVHTHFRRKEQSVLTGTMTESRLRREERTVDVVVVVLSSDELEFGGTKHLDHIGHEGGLLSVVSGAWMRVMS